MSRKNNLFKAVPIQKPKRNLFDLSHEVKTSMRFGYLYPVLLMDCLPGDTIRDQMTAMVRFAPMLSPVYHKINVTTHFFFVPNRLLTDSWEDFITGGQDGLVAPTLPYITPSGIGASRIAKMQKGSLWDYLGLPTAYSPATLSTQHISVLPFRAYTKIFNDYYRDPNLETEVVLNEASTGDVSTLSRDLVMDLRLRGWDKDYFTAALPWAQRGAEVLMPLAGTGDVTYKQVSSVFKAAGTFADAGSMGVNGVGELMSDFAGTADRSRIENIDEVTFDNTTVSINDFRRSLAIQKWLENNARGGGRYIEQVQSHFAVRVPDYRLQRAEYLGGGVQPVVISEVLATASTESATSPGTPVPVGDMAGHGLSIGKSNRFTYRCQEHGYVIGIMSIMPVPSYQLGIEKHWLRADKFDFAWPELAHLGEQEIQSKELFFDFETSGESANDAVFGYIPRYSEYKFKNDRFTGDFRDTLAFWHLGRIFNDRPQLDNAFLRCNDDAEDEASMRRIFAVQSGDYLWVQLFHRLTAKRPLPYFGVPQLI